LQLNVSSFGNHFILPIFVTLDRIYVRLNILSGRFTLQKQFKILLDELKASRASRKRAWDVLQEIRWVLKDTAGIEIPPPARKTIDLEGRLVKDTGRQAIRDRQNALTDLTHAIREHRKFADKPLALQGTQFSS
jgi:hypothetical protein